MVVELKFNSMRAYQAIFRIGFFLAYNEELPFFTQIRDYLRQNGYTSTFFVSDYPSNMFENNRKKSFYFLKDSHAPFFFLNKDVGKGGVVAEFEEYIREIYPNKGKTAVIFEKCANLGDKLKEEPSSLLTPLIGDETFHVRRYIEPKEVKSMVLGAANQLFYDHFQNPISLLIPPSYRLKCELCGEVSEYICLKRCNSDCTIYHICNKCYNTHPTPHGYLCHQNPYSFYYLSYGNSF